MNVFEYNQSAWNQEARARGPWSLPVSDEQMAAARAGRPKLLLTPTTPVPSDWLRSVSGSDVLCLASGGGQQAPLLAAAGANVTVLDCSEEQLALDRAVCERHSLRVSTVLGDMAEVPLRSQSFDLIVNACSTLFVPDVLPVWAEAHRMLRPSGTLIAGFLNPLYFLFDRELDDSGELVVRHALPYSDLTGSGAARGEKKRAEHATLEFGHTLTDQLGGQIAAGFAITGFFEDRWNDRATNLNRYTPVYIVTRAQRA